MPAMPSPDEEPEYVDVNPRTSRRLNFDDVRQPTCTAQCIRSTY